MEPMNVLRLAGVLACVALLAGSPLGGETDARRAAPGTVSASAADSAAAVAAYAERFGAPARLAALIHAEAIRQGLAPGLAFAVVELESGFDAGAIGRQGEIGLMQIKPQVAGVYGRIDPAALARPEVNLSYGLTHLKREVERFGDTRLGLLAYNMGRTRLARHLAEGRVPLSGYARRVLARCGADC